MQYYCYFYHQNSCVFLSVSFPKKSQILYLFIISYQYHTLSLSQMVFIQFLNAKTCLITITTMTHSLYPPKDEADNNNIADLSFFPNMVSEFSTTLKPS